MLYCSNFVMDMILNINTLFSYANINKVAFLIQIFAVYTSIFT